MLIWSVIFVISLAVLVTAARFFTNAAEKVGQALNFPAFVTGIFIVGIGTSLPELITAIVSVNSGAGEIVAGNLIGANVSNIFLILGVTAVLNRKEINLGSRYIMVDLHYMLGSALLIFICMYDGAFTLGEGLISIAVFVAYSVYIVKAGNPEVSHSDIPGDSKPAKKLEPKVIAILILSGVGIYFGAEYTVTSISKISEMLSIPKSLIALTVLSLGTTLPELAVNYFAIKEGKAEMAVGNILGSTIFNALTIPGIASLFGSIAIPAEITGFALPLLVAASVFFYLLTQDKRISLWEGVLFLIFYALFLLKSAGVV